jgi:tRNA A-37 threonylcarbamoyl transferase component Bud32
VPVVFERKEETEKMNVSVKTVRTEDRDFVCAVAEKVFAAYDGRGINWILPTDSGLWKINSGHRAGVVGVEINRRQCCVKLFYDSRPLVKIRNFVGVSKARRAFENALKLHRMGVGCPEMTGLVRFSPSGPLLIVSELCDYAERMDRWLVQQNPDMEIVKRFADFVRTMHEEGISHIDFSLRNMMLFYREGYKFLLLDHEDVRFGRKVSRQERLNNLHHLNERALKIVSLRWRLRFLKEYSGQKQFREWAYELDKMITRKPSKYTG